MADEPPRPESASEKPVVKTSKHPFLPSALRPLDLFRRREGQQQDPRLSFYQRHFTRPAPTSSSASSSFVGSLKGSIRSTSKDKTATISVKKGTLPPPAASDAPPARSFSLLSRGAILSFLLFAVVLVAVLVPVLVTQLAKHDSQNRGFAGHGSNQHQGQNASNLPVSPSSLGDPLAYQFSKPPIRLALLTNFPDPSLHYDVNSSTWYAFATNNRAGVLLDPGTNIDPTDPSLHIGANVQVATSTDFLTWTLRDASSDALPVVGAWARQGNGTSGSANDDDAGSNSAATGVSIQGVDLPLSNVWAPDVIQHPSQPNTYLLYYSAVSASGEKHPHCIGAATASTPAGPYTPVADALACPIDMGGAIDPVAAVDVDDNNAIYVAYKIDGNSLGHGGECGNTVNPITPTPIMLQRMAADGLTPDPAHPAVQLLDRTDVDGPLIEAPSLVKAGDTWYLFYSSGCTRNPSYDVRFATAQNITGPYTRNPDPLMVTGDYDLEAPGSVSVRWAQDAAAGGTSANDGGSAAAETLNGGWKVAVHARVRTSQGGVRATFTAGMVFHSNRTVTLVPGLA